MSIFSVDFFVGAISLLVGMVIGYFLMGQKLVTDLKEVLSIAEKKIEEDVLVCRKVLEVFRKDIEFVVLGIFFEIFFKIENEDKAFKEGFDRIYNAVAPSDSLETHLKNLKVTLSYLKEGSNYTYPEEVRDIFREIDDLQEMIRQTLETLKECRSSECKIFYEHVVECVNKLEVKKERLLFKACQR
ncbi:hypothetical protein ACFL08_04120 [Patescibacteria group bacterium]